MNRKSSPLARARSRVARARPLLIVAAWAISMTLGLDPAAAVGPPATTSSQPSSPASDSCTMQALVEAEKQYEHRLKKRNAHIRWYIKEKNKGLIPEILLGPTYPCILQTRVGYWAEGGKWVCMKHFNVPSKPRALSIGYTGDSFEEDFEKQFGGFSFLFDPTLNSTLKWRLQTRLPFLRFFNMGLSGKAEIKSYHKKTKEGVFTGIDGIMKVTGETYFDILKVSCAGCEVGFVKDLADLYDRKSVPFGQIQMEITTAVNDTAYCGLLVTLESLGYRLFQSEVNSAWNRNYEVAYIHERLVQPQQSGGAAV